MQLYVVTDNVPCSKHLAACSKGDSIRKSHRKGVSSSLQKILSVVSKRKKNHGTHDGHYHTRPLIISMIVHGAIWKKDRDSYSATAVPWNGIFNYFFKNGVDFFIDTRRSIQGGWLAIRMLFTTSMDDVYLVSIILCAKPLWAVW